MSVCTVYTQLIIMRMYVLKIVIMACDKNRYDSRSFELIHVRIVVALFKDKRKTREVESKNKITEQKHCEMASANINCQIYTNV